MRLARRALLGALALALPALSLAARAAEVEGDAPRLGDLQPGRPRPEGQGVPGGGAEADGHHRALGPVARLQQGAGISECRRDRLRLVGRRRRPGRARSTATRSRRSTPSRGRNGRRSSPARTPASRGRRPQGQARRRHPRHRPAHLPDPRAPGRGPDRAATPSSSCSSTPTAARPSTAATSTPGPASTR